MLRGIYISNENQRRAALTSQNHKCFFKATAWMGLERGEEGHNCVSVHAGEGRGSFLSSAALDGRQWSVN